MLLVQLLWAQHSSHKLLAMLPPKPISSSLHPPQPSMSNAPVPHDFEDADEDDVLSFCDLPFAAVDQPEGYCPSGPAHPPASLLRDGSDFEFSTGPAISAVDAFLFCGTSIPHNESECHVSSLLLHSDSFGPRDRLLWSNTLLRVMRSSSPVAPATACTRSPPPRRRHRALIGIAKFPARMELSDIRKRQGRPAPAPLFPVAVGGKEAVAGGKSGGHWSLLRPLRCRSHLVNALAKATQGFIPHA